MYASLSLTAFITMVKYFLESKFKICMCVCVVKPEGKRPLGRPRHRWEDNIKMDLEEVGGSCGDWMELAQDRDRWRALVGTLRNLRVPKLQGIS